MRKSEGLGDHDYTTVDIGTNEVAAAAFGYATAINAPFSGTPTPLAAVGLISSGEITAQTSRGASASTTEPGSTPDPTTSTKLDPGFVHLVPGTLVDAYEVDKLLGAGGMGAVYGAHHERLGRRAAIKVISPSLSRDRGAVERFEQEAQALARISHPNIVSVLSVGTLPGDGRAYFVMEWLDGESLQARLDRGAIGFGLALYVLDQIARGLEVAHGAGIVHRDLKPDNVWLQHLGDDPRPIVKILDFGLAQVAKHRRSEHTATNVMFGTTPYMSPEQCRSARDVGPATDVYALGCVAYELLCGRLPFTYDNMAELIAAHQSDEPPRPLSLNPSIDPTLDTLLAAMLAKDPNERPTLSRVRHAIANTLATPTSPPRLSPPTGVSVSDRHADGAIMIESMHALGREDQAEIALHGRSRGSDSDEFEPTVPIPVSRARPASIVPADKPEAQRRILIALGGLIVVGIVIAAAVARSGSASFDQAKRVTEEPKGAIKIDASIGPSASAAPSVILDASVPLAVPASRVDASTVTSRSNDNPDSPPVARHSFDGEVQESAAAVVVEPDSNPATMETTNLDASVEPGDEAIIEPDAAVEGDAVVAPATTSPSSHRTPQAPTAKRLPNRDGTPPVAAKKPPKRNVISDPFKNKEITK